MVASANSKVKTAGKPTGEPEKTKLKELIAKSKMETAKLDDLQQRLEEAKAKTASSSASGQFAAIAGLAGNSRSVLGAAAVVKIHNKFMNDTRPSAILVSCIIALDRPKNANATMLQTSCEKLFEKKVLRKDIKYKNSKGQLVHDKSQTITSPAAKLLRGQRIHIEKMAEIGSRTVMTGLLESFAKNCTQANQSTNKNCIVLREMIVSLAANK